MPVIPQDAQVFFDQMVPAALTNHPEKAKEVGAVYLFRIAGEGGGDWTVDLVGDPPTCTRGDRGNAQCTIQVSHEDFKAMLANPQLGMQLFFQGKLVVTGDPMLATKLQQFFQYGSSGSDSKE
ncbi:MAG: SCP2 sterol-binding domain-containing protein [Pseudomonadota bacterium]